MRERQECGEVGIFLSKDVSTRQLLSRQDNRGRSYKARGGFLEKKQDGRDCGGDTYVYANRGGGDLPRWRSANRDSKDPFTQRNNQ